MLETHGRYDHSSIVSRPVYDWPDGTGSPFMSPSMSRCSPGGAARAQASRRRTRRSARRCIPGATTATASASGGCSRCSTRSTFRARRRSTPPSMSTARTFRNACGRAATKSWATASPTPTNRAGCRKTRSARNIEEVTRAIAENEGAPPTGWMSPWLSNSPVTLDLLQEAGYRYVMDWTHDDQPVWMRTRSGGRILSMPYPIETNDNRALVWFRYSSDDYAGMLIDCFDEMLDQSTAMPLVFPISLHPFVVGRPYRMRALRRVFEHIARHRDRIWLTRPGEICRHVESLPAGTVPATLTRKRSGLPSDRKCFTLMAAIDLTQAEADALLSLEKRRADDIERDYPGLGGSLSIPLVSTDGREDFSLDLYRGRINLSKGRYQTRGHQIAILARLDFGGAPHRNPDGTEIGSPIFISTEKALATSGHFQCHTLRSQT